MGKNAEFKLLAYDSDLECQGPRGGRLGGTLVIPALEMPRQEGGEF